MNYSPHRTTTATAIPANPNSKNKVHYIKNIHANSKLPYFEQHPIDEQTSLVAVEPKTPLFIRLHHDQPGDFVCTLEVGFFTLESYRFYLNFISPFQTQENHPSIQIGVKSNSKDFVYHSFINPQGHQLHIEPHFNPECVLIFKLSLYEVRSCAPVFPRIGKQHIYLDHFMKQLNQIKDMRLMGNGNQFVEFSKAESRLVTERFVHVFHANTAKKMFHSSQSPMPQPSLVSPHQDTSIVKINVGGTHYTTSRQTLLKIPYFTNDIPSFIDRDGELFGYLLKYIRGDQHPHYLPKDPQIRELLAMEASFYQMSHLKKHLQQSTQKMPMQTLYFYHSDEEQLGEVVPQKFTQIKHGSMQLSIHENSKCLFEWYIGDAAGHFAILVNGQQTGIIASNGYSIISEEPVKFNYASSITIRKVLQLPPGDHHVQLIAQSYDPLMPYKISGPIIVQVQRIPDSFFEASSS